MMNAADARLITERALMPDADMIRPYMERVEAKVRKAAAAGRRQIDNPLGTPLPDHTVEEAVRKALEARGYTWTHHPDPDPGHPGSSDYDTLSW